MLTITRKQRSISLQKKFTFAWIFLGIILLALIGYYQWQQLQLQYFQRLEKNATAISLRFDQFLHDSLESIHNLPSFLNALDCQKTLPQLQEALFNNPVLSGLVISNDKNQVICSTVKQPFQLPSLGFISPSLIGPLKIDPSMEEVFLLQHRVGQYSIGEFLLAKVLKNFLNNENYLFRNIILSDIEQQKELLQSNNSHVAKQNTLIFVKPSRFVSNIELIMLAPPATVDGQFILKEVIILGLFLLLFLLFYWYFSRLLCRRLSLSYAMNLALENNSFYPVYQPIWNNSLQRFCGAELLIRWKTAADEIIMPDYFIDEAEKTGLIIPISLQLIKNAFMQCCDLLAERRDLHLAINLSAQHFYSASFFSELYELCQYCSINPQQILLELTERELIDKNQDIIIYHMQELREKGFSLAVDDFGTGHASINYLRHFPFNYLKIDKIFIQAIGSGAVTETLNKAIINLANSLELAIIAEGIETEEQRKFLQENKIELMQGWYFSKAIHFDQLLLLIQG